MAKIKTFEDAYRFVLENKVCTVFGSKNSPYPSLWDNTALSEKKPKSGGWSPKVTAVWDWKTRIPQTYPDAIFYGKVQGGDAVLMEMQHFSDVHFAEAYQPVHELDTLSQQLYEFIRLEPDYTGPLRKRAIAELGCTKSRFDTALKKLQISLNIVRSNDPRFKNDFWLPMREVHWTSYKPSPKVANRACYQDSDLGAPQPVLRRAEDGNLPQSRWLCGMALSRQRPARPNVRLDAPAVSAEAAQLNP